VNPQQTPQKTERIHHRDPTQHAAAIDPTPCFYPDSQGVMRLWDGQRWTEATRPMPHPATPPTGQPGYYTDSQGVMRWWTGRDWAPHTQPPGTGQPEPEKGNWIQRNVGWKLGVLLAILGLASCGAIINTIGGGEDPATTAQPTSATMATTAPPVDETTEPEPEPEPVRKPSRLVRKSATTATSSPSPTCGAGCRGWVASTSAKRRKASSAWSSCGSKTWAMTPSTSATKTRRWWTARANLFAR
jgi:hypothetical protein